MMSSLCPRHHVPLDGGPIMFRCPEGHSVYAADLDNEFRPTGPVTRVPPLAQAAFAWSLATSFLLFIAMVVTR